ncbi:MULTISPECIES: Dabb family protein [Saccharibacillus]|uniref:Dabb family protein n=1 Tax=Saccharibacillus brassicae TaxID=2583377 RepID=A0A4Y6V1D7_SACBS|nr:MULTISPECIES: Dabb family protein [Saccharibacillus]MWJ33545.1 Dabb family protein [Saccharibacillus sp. WB 17]QDH22618.1 Dabb family protein [Saccharibacillus brassicae]
MIKHIVFFKLKNRSAESVAEAADVLRSMDGQIEQLRSFEVGTDILRSERSYDIALTATVETLDDLEAYQTHPVHRKIIEYINGVKEISLAVDYEV